MSLRVITVYKRKLYKHFTPTIIIEGKWMQELGFVANSYLRKIKHEDFFELVLDETPVEPSSLTKGGYLKSNTGRVKVVPDGGNLKARISGLWLLKMGFNYEGKALMLLEHGRLVFRPLNVEDDMLYVFRKRNNHNYKTHILLTGEWLADYGFTDEKIIYCEYEQGHITLNLRDAGKEEFLTVKNIVLKTPNTALLYVQRRYAHFKYYLSIEIKENWLDRIGFTPESLFTVRKEMGRIDIIKYEG